MLRYYFTGSIACIGINSAFLSRLVSQYSRRFLDSTTISDNRGYSLHVQNTTVQQTPVNANTPHVPTHSHKPPTLSPARFLVKEQVIPS